MNLLHSSKLKNSTSSPSTVNSLSKPHNNYNNNHHHLSSSPEVIPTTTSGTTTASSPSAICNNHHLYYQKSTQPQQPNPQQRQHQQQQTHKPIDFSYTIASPNSQINNPSQQTSNLLQESSEYNNNNNNYNQSYLRLDRSRCTSSYVTTQNQSIKHHHNLQGISEVQRLFLIYQHRMDAAWRLTLSRSEITSSISTTTTTTANERSSLSTQPVVSTPQTIHEIFKKETQLSTIELDILRRYEGVQIDGIASRDILSNLHESVITVNSAFRGKLSSTDHIEADVFWQKHLLFLKTLTSLIAFETNSSSAVTSVSTTTNTTQVNAGGFASATLPAILWFIASFSREIFAAEKSKFELIRTHRFFSFSHQKSLNNNLKNTSSTSTTTTPTSNISTPITSSTAITIPPTINSQPQYNSANHLTITPVVLNQNNNNNNYFPSAPISLTQQKQQILKSQTNKHQPNNNNNQQTESHSQTTNPTQLTSSKHSNMNRISPNRMKQRPESAGIQITKRSLKNESSRRKLARIIAQPSTTTVLSEMKSKANTVTTTTTTTTTTEATTFDGLLPIDASINMPRVEFISKSSTLITLTNTDQNNSNIETADDSEKFESNTAFSTPFEDLLRIDTNYSKHRVESLPTTSTTPTTLVGSATLIDITQLTIHQQQQSKLERHLLKGNSRIAEQIRKYYEDAQMNFNRLKVQWKLQAEIDTDFSIKLTEDLCDLKDVSPLLPQKVRKTTTIAAVATTGEKSAKGNSSQTFTPPISSSPASLAVIDEYKVMTVKRTKKQQANIIANDSDILATPTIETQSARISSNSSFYSSSDQSNKSTRINRKQCGSSSPFKISEKSATSTSVTQQQQTNNGQVPCYTFVNQFRIRCQSPKSQPEQQLPNSSSSSSNTPKQVPFIKIPTNDQQINKITVSSVATSLANHGESTCSNSNTSQPILFISCTGKRVQSPPTTATTTTTTNSAGSPSQKPQQQIRQVTQFKHVMKEGKNTNISQPLLHSELKREQNDLMIFKSMLNKNLNCKQQYQQILASSARASSNSSSSHNHSGNGFTVPANLKRKYYSPRRNQAK